MEVNLNTNLTNLERQAAKVVSRAETLRKARDAAIAKAYAYCATRLTVLEAAAKDLHEAINAARAVAHAKDEALKAEEALARRAVEERAALLERLKAQGAPRHTVKYPPWAKSVRTRLLREKQLEHAAMTAAKRNRGV